MSDPSISIIAVSYFGAADARLLVDSLLPQDFDDWQLVIVDNSVDPTERELLQELASDDARIRILFSVKNLGYFGAAHHAFDVVSPLGDVVVMNTDVVFGGPTVLGQLRRESLSRDDLGVLAPAIISERSGRDQNPHLVAMPSVRVAAMRRWATATPLLTQLSLLLSDVRRRKRPLPGTQPGEVSLIYAAHGSFMYLTEKYFASSGDLRHPLFLFGEEIYVAEHARRAGLETWHLPMVTMNHVEHGTMGIRRSRAVLQMSGKATRYALHTAKAAAQERRSDSPQPQNGRTSGSQG